MENDVETGTDSKMIIVLKHNIKAINWMDTT